MTCLNCFYRLQAFAYWIYLLYWFYWLYFIMLFSKKKRDFDLIIIGSGAGGSVGAHTAANLGKKVAIFEKAEVGGECPNWACVPTKSLLHAAHVYKNAGEGEQYGTIVKDVSLDFAKVKKWRDLVVERTGAAHGKESFQHEHIKLIGEEAKFVSAYEIEANGKTYSAHNFLIATGTTTFIPPIPGLKESGFVTFKEIGAAKELPKSLFILGGSAVGCEFAQIFTRFGTKVTIADTVDKLLFREDKEVSELVQGIFESENIKVLTGINVEKVEKRGDAKIVHYKKGHETHTIEVEEILVATGKRPLLDFNPDKAGIKIDDGRLKVNDYLQTNVKHIYAAGDIIGPYQFTPTGYYQSDIAVNNMFKSKKLKPDYRIVPRAVYLSPEIASVGVTETQLREKKIKYKVGLAATGILGRANTSNEFNGFVKVITDKNGIIIGGAIVSPSAGEIIHEIAVAIKYKAKAEDLANMIHAYPTFSEGVKIACSSIE